MTPAPSDRELAEAIAQRVAELVAARPLPQLLTVEQVAEMLQVRPGWVYEHAELLGAYRLGDGARGRLRFDVEHVRAGLGAPPAAASGGLRRAPARPRRSPPARTPLLRVGPKR